MDNCDKCAHRKEDEQGTVPVSFHKTTIDSKNSIIKLLVTIIIVQFIGFMVYIGYNEWLSAQFDTVTEDVDVITDGGGDANYADDGSTIRYYINGKDQD